MRHLRPRSCAPPVDRQLPDRDVRRRRGADERTPRPWPLPHVCSVPSVDFGLSRDVGLYSLNSDTRIKHQPTGGKGLISINAERSARQCPLYIDFLICSGAPELVCFVP
jgi:hypothetical protein